MNDNDINKAIREQLIKQLIKTDINAEVITGYQPEEITDNNIIMFFPIKEEPRLAEKVMMFKVIMPITLNNNLLS